MTQGLPEVEIRPGAEKDIAEVAALWCEAFPGRRTVAERARMLETGGKYGGLETVLVARDPDNDLLAACKIYRLTQRITGVAVPMMGLAAVAVTPGARRQGLGSRLCRHAMAAARQRGDVISVLYPFRPDYYERLGWGLVGELHEYRFRTVMLPGSEGARHVRPARDAEDAAALAACYARVAARSHGPIERDARLWEWRLAGEDLGVRVVDGKAADATPRGGVWVYDRNGVTGYALVRRKGERIDVRELVAETEEAYHGLIGHLASHADRWAVGRHFARPDERFGDRLTDPRPPDARRARSLYFPTARVVRGPMLRLLDAAGALGLRTYFDRPGWGERRDAVIDIFLADRQIEENQRPWRLSITDGAGEVTPADGEPAQHRIATDAATLARIFAGDLAPADAQRLGRASLAGDAHLMDAAFATREPFWLLDEF
jgi:predicted acetyltransferase